MCETRANDTSSVEELKKRIEDLESENALLREKEEKYHTLFNNIPIGLFWSRMDDGTLIDCNEKFAEILGYDSIEECLAGFSASKHYADINFREKMLNEISAGGVLKNFEARFIRTDGEPVWVSYSARLYPEKNLIEGGGMDVTEKKRAGEALRESEIKYSALVENATDGVSIIQDGIIKYANRALIGITGYSVEELMEKPFHEFVEPESRTPVFERHKRRMAGEKVETTYEMRILCKDGSIKTTEVSANVINYKGKTAVIAITRDISDRKKIEEQMRILSLVAEKSPYPIAITDKNEVVEYANKKFIELNNWKEKNVIGKNWRSFSSPDNSLKDKYDEVYRIAIQEGNIWQGEISDTNENGEPVWRKSIIVPVKNEDNSLDKIIYISEDITERRQIEKLIETQNRLSIALSTATSTNEALTTVLDTVTGLDTINMGGIYLRDSSTGKITLDYSKNLPDYFLSTVSDIEPGSSREQIMLKGDPAYINYEKMNLPADDPRISEGVKSVAVIPILHRGDVIACINVASKTHREIPLPIRNVLESMSSQIGDVIARLRAEEQIKKSLHEKDVLLREIHHRVKNNMQIINSLLNLQAAQVKNKEYAGILKESQERIKSMSLVHEHLYRSLDLAHIDLTGYIKTLTNSLFRSYGVDTNRITLELDIEKIFLTIDVAIPCGLIINELVSNSLKYAFPDERKGNIKIALHSIDKNKIEIDISDNGTGIPEDIDLNKSKTLGLHLVTLLAQEQLKGDIKFDRTEGTRFIIHIEKERERASI